MPVKLSSSSGESDGEEARIEIVPLIDIMFFLLASFMLVSLSMTHVSRVPIVVPKSSTSAVENQVPPIHIAIDKHGIITWDQKVVTPTEVTARLKGIPTAVETGVFVGGDEETTNKQTMTLIDAIRSAGINKVGLETRKMDK
jgi:biopolymer transport protein ExbD